MDIKLHLMDDRKIIKTVPTTIEGASSAFLLLMDHLEDSLEDYPCAQSDANKDYWNVIRNDIARAQRNPPATADQITKWYSDIFNVVVHAYKGE